MPSLLVVLVLCLLSTQAAILPPLDVRLAASRTDQAYQCIPRSGIAFINATLTVLALPERGGIEPGSVALTSAEYPVYLGRFVSLLAQNMASGRTFCQAFGRTCCALAVEWTREYYPQEEGVYVTHCETVVRATDEAAYYLWTGPAFENELYQCLRVGLKAMPSTSSIMTALEETGGVF